MVREKKEGGREKRRLVRGKTRVVREKRGMVRGNKREGREGEAFENNIRDFIEYRR